MIEPYLRQSALDHLGLAGRTGSGGATVRLHEKTLPAAVNLRGDAGDPAFVAAVRGALGLEPPTAPNTVAAGGGLALLWLGPNEWLAVQHHPTAGAEAQLAAKLRSGLADAPGGDAPGGLHAAVTEVGESLACISVTGPMARAVIAKGCPLDMHPRAFGGDGHCAQSHLSHATITLHQVSDDGGQGPAFDLYVRRSFSDYLWRWLEDAAREYEAMAVKA